MRQLQELSRAMRALIREDLEFVEPRQFQLFQREVDSLQGHQDIKDMFAGLDDMEFIPSLRRMADILELIDTKLEALELEAARARGNLEGVAGMSLDEIANADTDVETDAETDDEEDVSCRFRF